MSLRIRRLRFLLASLLPCFLASVSFAGTVTGTVHNGTTGKPAAGVEITLIQLQGGMQPVADTKTDSQGRFQFDNPVLGTAPMLLRAAYRGVNYHQPVPPGTTTADIEVYDSTDRPGAFSVTTHAIILQPNGSELIVGEEFNIQNKTEPPVAYYRDDGSFLFSLPEGAQIEQVSASGSAGMPVVQSPVDKGKNEEAIAFPFRPGDSDVRVGYRVPYPDNQTKLRFVSPYAVDRLAILAPPSVQVTGDGFSPAGQEQGFNVYMRETVAANMPLSVAVSGTAPPPQQDSGAPASPGGGDDSQNPSVNSRADSGAEAPSVTATALPARLDSLKWILVSSFAAIFALGLVYLWRRPEAVPAHASDVASASASISPVPPHTSLPQSVAATSADREVSTSLDALKDALFRIELRHEAGTIGEEQYIRERERLRKILSDLVKG